MISRKARFVARFIEHEATLAQVRAVGGTELNTGKEVGNLRYG